MPLAQAPISANSVSVSTMTTPPKSRLVAYFTPSKCDCSTKGFLPPLSMDYRVHTVHSGQILSLTGHTDSKGIYVELQANAMMLRKLHTHEGHRNPDGVEISGLHIHFPTQKYPMAYGKSEWAYPINLPYDDDLETCVQFFCHELGIDITTLQFQFDFRRR
jgi:hypothetical protein